nr:reverse transcriptase domain-containing protein [Tanacetum cinerariifolium]
MSDSEDSTITYTAVSSPFRGLSDIRSPGVDGPPVMPEDPYAYVVAAFQAPPSPDYVLGPEHPPLPVYVPEFVQEPVYPEFMPVEDDILPAEEEPLPAAVSPTTESPGYIDEFDPDEDPEEDHEDDPEEDPTDYPADGGDEGDNKDESSDDDEDDDIDFEGDEEDEYLASADSTAVTLPAIDHAPSAEETEPFETNESAAIPPHPTYRVTARMSIRPQTPISLPSDTKITRLMAIPTPPPSPIPEVDLPLRKRLCTAHSGTYELGESSAAAAARLEELVRDDLYRFVDTVERREGSMPATIVVSYDITDTWDDLVGAIQEIAPTIVERVNQRAQLMDASDAARSGVIALRTQVSAQQTEITNLWAADCRIQTTKMTPKRTTRATPATTTTTTTTSMTDAQLEALIEQGIAKALAARDADRNTNGDDSHLSRVDLKKTMTDKYCPRGEMKKLESELRNLRVKGNDVVSYNQRFQELALLSTANVNTANNHRGNGIGQKPTCYECGSQGHFKKDCLKFKNNNHGTQ